MENLPITDFNYFDVAISSIVVILAIKGFFQGFIKEVFGLAGLIIGIYLGSRYAPESATFIEENFFKLDNNSLLQLIGFLSILIVVWLSATIIGALISHLMHSSGLGFINRLFGFIAGGGKYLLIFALIVTALSNAKPVKKYMDEYVKDSVLYPHLKEVGEYLMQIDTSRIIIENNTSK